MENRIVKSRLVHKIFMYVPNLHKVASDVGNTFLLYCAKIEENQLEERIVCRKLLKS